VLVGTSSTELGHAASFRVVLGVELLRSAG